MKITDVLTNYDSYEVDTMFSDDFDTLENELNELLYELEEVIGWFYNLNVVMEHFNPDYCVYDMDNFDLVFEGTSPLDLVRKLYPNNFNAWDCYFSFDDVYGIYSGNDLNDFEELNMLNDTLMEVKSIASAIIDYINGEYFIGLDGVEGIEGETLRAFNDWLNDQRNEGLHEDDNDYSAAVMAQM